MVALPFACLEAADSGPLNDMSQEKVVDAVSA